MSLSDQNSVMAVKCLEPHRNRDALFAAGLMSLDIDIYDERPTRALLI